MKQHPPNGGEKTSPVSAADAASAIDAITSAPAHEHAWDSLKIATEMTLLDRPGALRADAFEAICIGVAKVYDADALTSNETITAHPLTPALVRFAARAMSRYAKGIERCREEAGLVTPSQRYRLLAECFSSIGPPQRPTSRWNEDARIAYVNVASAAYRGAIDAGRDNLDAHRLALQAAMKRFIGNHELSSIDKRKAGEMMLQLLTAHGWGPPPKATD